MSPQGIKYYDIPTHPQSQRLKDIAVSSTSWSMEKQETPATSSSGFLKLVRSWYDLFSHPFRRMAMNYDPFCDSLKRGQASFATKSWDARRRWGRVHVKKKKCIDDRSYIPSAGVMLRFLIILCYLERWHPWYSATSSVILIQDHHIKMIAVPYW